LILPREKPDNIGCPVVSYIRRYSWIALFLC
jgi:hypothetical protein